MVKCDVLRFQISNCVSAAHEVALTQDCPLFVRLDSKPARHGSQASRYRPLSTSEVQLLKESSAMDMTTSNSGGCKQQEQYLRGKATSAAYTLSVDLCVEVLAHLGSLSDKLVLASSFHNALEASRDPRSWKLCNTEVTTRKHGGYSSMLHNLQGSLCTAHRKAAHELVRS